MACSYVQPSLTRVSSPHVTSHSTGGGGAACDIAEPASATKASYYVQLHYPKTPISKQHSKLEITEPMRSPSLQLSWSVPRRPSLVNSCITTGHQYQYCQGQGQGNDDECYAATSCKQHGTVECQCMSPIALHNTANDIQSPSTRLTMTSFPQDLRVDIRSPGGIAAVCSSSSSSSTSGARPVEFSHKETQTTLEEPPAPRGTKRCKIFDFDVSNDAKLSHSGASTLFPALWVNCEAEMVYNHPTEPMAPRHALFAGRMWATTSAAIVVR